MKKLKKIISRKIDFAKWYVDVVKQSGLIDYGPVKGTIILKPLACDLWDNIKANLNSKIKSLNAKSIYFPLLIPEEMINREKKHIDGFLHELATITRIGPKKLSQPVVIRPTSEVLFSTFFAKSNFSQHDFPVIYNQWANIIRWEKTTNPFLRTSEFLWQEGHSLHLTSQEGHQFAKEIIQMYHDFLKDFLAIPSIIGIKSEAEKFAGAQTTFTIEARMYDGKALQAGTSHDLGQNFVKAFDIKYDSSENLKKMPFQTSWGVSTRLIGALIMVHGDDNGLVLPPKIAPIQIDILTILANKDIAVLNSAKKIAQSLSDTFRISLDSSDKSLGYKAAESEIKGTPIRIEVGPKDLANEEVVVVRRDLSVKTKVKISSLNTYLSQELEKMQNDLYQNAYQKLFESIVTVDNYEDFKKEIACQKFVLAPFCGSIDDELIIKNETFATIRCLPLTKIAKNVKKAPCIITKKITQQFYLFSKSY